MPTRTWQSGFLSTRVGRRTLAHFLGASLLPVLMVAVVGVLFVRRTLETESIARVQRTSQSVSLLLLGALTGVTREFAARPEGKARTNAITVTADEDAHLRGDAVVLRALHDAHNASDEGQVLQLRRLRSGAIASEVVRPALLWESLDELVSTERAHFCVFVTGSWHRLHCSPDADDREVARLRNAAARTNTSQGAAVDGNAFVAHRDIFLRYQFGAGEWRIVSSEPRVAVMASSQQFTTTLTILLALAVVAAFGLGHRQIRRSTVPLEALRDATRRVMRGDLRTLTEINTRDEYAELGAAFNLMTGAIDRQIGLLRSMDAVDEAALRERQEEAIVSTALAQFREMSRCERAVIAIANDDDVHTLVQWSSDAPSAPPARVIQSEADRAELLAHPRCHITRAPASHHDGDALSHRDTQARAVLPLVHDAELLGVITIALRGDADAYTDDLTTAQRLADRIALGLANVRLFHRVEALSTGALTAFASAIDANSPWTAGHSARVTQVALALGRELQLPKTALATLYRGAMMHDIGKIGVPQQVLNKEERLTADETALLRRHPEIGERILSSLTPFREALPVIRSHHERMDGRGYPDQLIGESIPWLARVLAVADAFDALVSDRPYRAGLSVRAALAVIESEAGSHFDARVVAALITLDSNGLLASATVHGHTPGRPAADTSAKRQTAAPLYVAAT